MRRALVLWIAFLLLSAGVVSPVRAAPPAAWISTQEFLREMVEQLYTSVPKEFAGLSRGAPPRVRREAGLLSVLGFPPGEKIRWRASVSRGMALRMTLVLAQLPIPPSTPRGQYRDVRAGSADQQLVAADEEYGLLGALTEQTYGLRKALRDEEFRRMVQRLRGDLVLPLALPTLPEKPETVRQERQKGQKTRTAPAKGEEGSSPTITFQLAPQRKDAPHGDLLETIWGLIEQRYLRAKEIDRDEAGYQAIEALVKTLKDPYSTFYRPRKALDFKQELEGEIYGIGAQVEDREGKIFVVSPLPGSPAERGGLLPGDEIVEVDGMSLVGLSLTDAVAKIRGPVGTVVTLTLRRNGAPLLLRIERAKITIPEILVEYQGQIPVVRLVQFGQATLQKLGDVLAEVVARHPRGMILDLRNNPGGLLSAAVGVLSHFLPAGTPVTEIRSRDGTEVERTESDPIVPADLTLAVLVNKGSASASEIVAAALQEYGRATIVGMKTFGKGTVQEVIQLRERVEGEEEIRESALKVTIADWYTPKGHRIEGQGVTPDIEIENEPAPVGQAGSRDLQLLRALQLMPR